MTIEYLVQMQFSTNYFENKTFVPEAIVEISTFIYE